MRYTRTDDGVRLWVDGQLLVERVLGALHVLELVLQQLGQVNKITSEGDTIIIHTREASSVLIKLVRMSEGNGLNLENISVRKATLEDVFLELTGKKLRE
mgnify:CR=1 FL=1